jgi:hypothetical protein
MGALLSTIPMITHAARPACRHMKMFGRILSVMLLLVGARVAAEIRTAKFVVVPTGRVQRAIGDLLEWVTGG